MSARKKIDLEEFRRRHEAGHSIPRLAEHFGISPRTVGNYRRELGLRSPRLLSPERLAKLEAMLDDGWSFKEIHRSEGVDVETLRRHFPGRAWTVAERVAHTSSLRYFTREAAKVAYAQKASLEDLRKSSFAS